MEYLIRDIEKALDAGLYFIALQSTLTLPDICAALESDDGKTNRSKYIAWYNTYVRPNINTIISAEDCYFFRCSYVHQGKAEKSNENASYDRLLFVFPNSRCYCHNNTIKINNIKALNLDIPTFCSDIIKCVRIWLELKKEDDNFKRNNEKLITVHPDGLPPFIVGTPVIG